MRGFYQLSQMLKVGKNCYVEVKNVQIHIFEDIQLCKKSSWGTNYHWSINQDHSEDWESNGGPVRDMYWLPDELKVGRNIDFGAEIAQIGIFHGSQLWKNASFEGLFPLTQQLWT